MEIREQLIEIACKTKTKLTKVETTALIDVIMDGARRRGIAIVDEGDVIGAADEHLKTLKSIRRIILEAVEDTESKRDLSSLTKRLQDVSREVTNIEERHRGEKAERGKSTNGSKTDRSAASSSGPLSI